MKACQESVRANSFEKMQREEEERGGHGLCGHCGESISRRMLCSKCRSVAYCCKDHQVAAWPEHKLLCKSLAAARADSTSAPPPRAAAAATPTPPPTPPPPLVGARGPQLMATDTDDFDEHRTLLREALDIRDPPPHVSADALQVASAHPMHHDPPVNAPRSEEGGGQRQVRRGLSTQGVAHGERTEGAAAGSVEEPQRSLAEEAEDQGARNAASRIKMLRLWSRLCGSKLVPGTRSDSVFCCYQETSAKVLYHQPLIVLRQARHA